eukprot:GHUV01038142.1.p1 GENE.GHUV01038142.1~~GHUV01038142.1.p1  ORF type:complete len:209 (+),score=49.04 GHUV01038142.1:220-846(+)
MSEQHLSGQPTSSASAQYQQQLASAAYANQQYAQQYAHQYAAVQQQQQQAAHHQQQQQQGQPYAGYGPHLRPFWEQQKQEVSQVGRDPAEFKNHQLPLARIKKVHQSCAAACVHLLADKKAQQQQRAWVVLRTMQGCLKGASSGVHEHRYSVAHTLVPCSMACAVGCVALHHVKYSLPIPCASIRMHCCGCIHRNSTAAVALLSVFRS